MPYIAHAAVQLRDTYPDCGIDEWHFIKRIDSIEYRWRLKKNHAYEVVSGIFDERKEALLSAKQMYVTLFYFMQIGGIALSESGCQFYEPNLYVEEFDGDKDTFFDNEEYFFYSKNKQGENWGPSVYEVENSFEELSEIHDFSMTVSIQWPGFDLSFDNVDDYLFTYSSEAQELLNAVDLATRANDFGMGMTIYCGLLEHLSETTDKDQDVLAVIDDLIKLVNSTTLTEEKKSSLINYLKLGRKISANQKCTTLCKKYAKDSYRSFMTKNIIREAYRIRSAFTHGENYDTLELECAAYIKLVVLDVIRNYLAKKEKDSFV